ncbi:hypothetical protein AVEN_69859-1 [Araneus ventricosus]|uniref:DDE-1 domain-containing protein n=1 Tax=Araneus ventricosus TaxID=182803 RepID=A0A4Y2W9M7_ARAVE|nr:hypothetical protein AVEN_257577-1 [Araneus ventricosus]GBO32707.1 hypothetical protein AVEN_69859-1 [Araneus ventricosus]
MENDANPNPALIQLMDQNVIQNIKLGYRKLLLTTILNDPLYDENLGKTQPNVNLKDVVFSLANWTSVSTLLINKSWKNLLPNFIDSVNSIKISYSEARAALNTSLQWAEEQNFEAHGNYAPQTFKKRPRI